MRTPEQEERAADEEHARRGAPPTSGFTDRFHRHTMDDEIHRDGDCSRGVMELGQWTTSRRRVYVFDDDYLDEHERIISERVWREGWEAKLRRKYALDNPYREEK